MRAQHLTRCVFSQTEHATSPTLSREQNSSLDDDLWRTLSSAHVQGQIFPQQSLASCSSGHFQPRTSVPDRPGATLEATQGKS